MRNDVGIGTYVEVDVLGVPVPVEDRVSAGVEMTETVGETDGEDVEPGCEQSQIWDT